jgi:hypothetical protein
MVQRGERASFVFEPGTPRSVAGHIFRQALDSNDAAQAPVASPIDLAHSAGSD